MGRRKKEPIRAHREHITSAASRLFMEKGISQTSMDDIARTAGYSKATLYVYFKNKEEIVRLIVLESMKKLYRYICPVPAKQDNTKDRYLHICHGLLKYQEEFPFYFNMVLDNLNIDYDSKDYLPEEEETYLIGVKINEELREFLICGIEKGDLRTNLEIAPTIFHFWGMLSGIIKLASNKETYIKNFMNLSKQQFLEYGFDMLYSSIASQKPPAF